MLPIRMLLRLLPVPLILALPVRVRFSRLLPKVQLMLDRTVSVPEESEILSLMLSTM